MAKLKDQLRALRDPRMLVVFMQGIASAMPLYVLGGIFQAWLKDSGINIKTISLLTLVSLPYTLKFLWSPVLDAVVLPAGRRKGWILLTQFLIVGLIFWISSLDPRVDIQLMAMVAFLLCFVGATEDIALDAWRREYLADQELALGISLNTTSYLIAMKFITGALAFRLADNMSYSHVYQIMAACMIPSIIAIFLSDEPKVEATPPKSLYESAVLPLVEFFSRDGAYVFLAFVLLYKIGENIAGVITTPYYLEMGFTKTQIGDASKIFGFFFMIGGTLTGGAALLRMKLRHGLWFFGIVQALATLSFILLKTIQTSPPSVLLLNSVIGVENFAVGLGTAAYATVIAKLTNKKFTATQYALLTSLMSVPRIVIGSQAGYMQSMMGWNGFFIFCTVIAIPGIFIALMIREDEHGNIVLVKGKK